MGLSTKDKIEFIRAHGGGILVAKMETVISEGMELSNEVHILPAAVMMAQMRRQRLIGRLNEYYLMALNAKELIEKYENWEKTQS
jgi:hypothetical protein